MRKYGQVFSINNLPPSIAVGTRGVFANSKEEIRGRIPLSRNIGKLDSITLDNPYPFSDGSESYRFFRPVFELSLPNLDSPEVLDRLNNALFRQRGSHRETRIRELVKIGSWWYINGIREDQFFSDYYMKEEQ